MGSNHAIKLDSVYERRALPVIREQLAKARVRLPIVLSEVMKLRQEKQVNRWRS